MANVSTWEFIVGFLYILGGLGIFPFWNAGDERRHSKSGWRRNAENNGDYDPKPVFRAWLRVCWSLAWFNRLQPPLSWWSAL